MLSLKNLPETYSLSLNDLILNPGAQEFIKNNWNTDIMSVLLKKQLFQGISQKELAEQLEAKKKCSQKLPSWFRASKIYYPNKLNIEQTSSELTARYKADLVNGKSLIDLTAGFGVDTYYFSKIMPSVLHCEMNEQLSKIASYNFKILGVKNVEFVIDNGIQFLRHTTKKFDWIYIDPSRRNAVKGKVFRFEDAAPNIPDHLSKIFEKTENVMIKAAPLLDISQGFEVLKFVKEVHVISVKNEVKELLFILRKHYRSTIKIKAINLIGNDHEVFAFDFNKERTTTSRFSAPLKFLYEPNAAILKSGGFKSIGVAHGLNKLHEHSHLYTSNDLIDFPGRRFMVLEVQPNTKRAIQKLGIKKANITTRNFSGSVADIRKKFKIADGGDDYLFFTSDFEGKSIVLKCAKI